jgi:SAM-dependent methyltransferase
MTFCRSENPWVAIPDLTQDYLEHTTRDEKGALMRGVVDAAILRVIRDAELDFQQKIILDVGCGNGALSLKIQELVSSKRVEFQLQKEQKSVELLGFDDAPEQIRLAHKLGHIAGDSAIFYRGSVDEPIPYAVIDDGQCGLITCTLVADHLHPDQKHEMLRHINRCIAPKEHHGLVLLTAADPYLPYVYTHGRQINLESPYTELGASRKTPASTVLEKHMLGKHVLPTYYTSLTFWRDLFYNSGFDCREVPVKTPPDVMERVNASTAYRFMIFVLVKRFDSYSMPSLPYHEIYPPRPQRDLNWAADYLYSPEPHQGYLDGTYQSM